MDEETLLENLTDYFVANPTATDDELASLIERARLKAKIKSIPSFNPIEVEDKSYVSSTYEETIEQKVVEHYEDESTFDETVADYDDF